MEILTQIVTEPDQRVDRIAQALTGLSRRQLRGLFDQGCVLVNGQSCGQPFMRVGIGDRVDVRYEPQRRYKEAPGPWRDPAFSVVYEDPHIVVVNKSAGYLTVPTPRGETDTLIDRVSVYLGARCRGQKAFIVHRLDRGVSGLLVFGKTKSLASKLRDQFELRKSHRQYVAIVSGRVDQEQGTIRSYLATAGNLDRYSTHRRDQGQLAITHYWVQKWLDQATLLRVRLETGRRNQIRVHLAEAGYPVLGDSRYKPELAQHPRWTTFRLALHAQTLGFDHPQTDEPMKFESVLPTVMTRFIAGVAPRHGGRGAVS